MFVCVCPGVSLVVWLCVDWFSARPIVCLVGVVVFVCGFLCV